MRMERVLAASRGPGDAFARLLASGEAIDLPVALVVAHPDDETLWAGSVLPRLRHLTLVHLTDGSPRDLSDARRRGFATREAYAAARAGELDAALRTLGAEPRRIAYGLVDQEAACDMAGLARRLARDLAGVAAIVTHPYEGGHPDHDAAALAAFAACRLLARAGHAPAHVEFACYARQGGTRMFGRFLPAPATPVHRRTFDAADRALVEAALACHASQADVFGDWRPTCEQWRAAPTYDFARPPVEGALYDGFGWRRTSADWRALAHQALASLGLC